MMMFGNCCHLQLFQVHKRTFQSHFYVQDRNTCIGWTDSVRLILIDTKWNEKALTLMSLIHSLCYNWFIYDHQALVDATLRNVNCSFQWCDVIGNVTVIKFLNKLSESVQKWVAIPIDQIWCKRWYWRSTSIIGAQCKQALTMHIC